MTTYVDDQETHVYRFTSEEEMVGHARRLQSSNWVAQCLDWYNVETTPQPTDIVAGMYAQDVPTKPVWP